MLLHIFGVRWISLVKPEKRQLILPPFTYQLTCTIADFSAHSHTFLKIFRALNTLCHEQYQL
jgi:hypothetical protein